MDHYRHGSRPANRRGDAIDGETPDEQPAALERLAAALGWERIPELTDDERRDADRKLQAAQAEARRIYGLDEAA